MFAVGLLRDKTGVHSFEIPKPQIKSPHEALVRVKKVGLDGTDFTIMREDRKDLAPDKDSIVMGHEVGGVVEEIGKEVKSLIKGDAVAVTVRRGCGECHPCLHNQSDMCMTGLFTERGIHKLDGFLTEYVVDEEQYVVRVPQYLSDYAFFVEPLSIVEKAVEQIKTIQSRLPWSCEHPEHSFLTEQWGNCKTALVVGAGPLGLLATALLKLAGVNIYVVDIVPDSHIKAELVRQLGATYITARDKSPEEVLNNACQLGTANIIFEASGASELALNLIPCTLRSSIYVMTGIPRGKLIAMIDSNELIRHIVRNNIVIVGSVNSNRTHFEKAVADLSKIENNFKGLLQNIVTHTFQLRDYEKAFSLTDPNRIKIVVEI